MQDSAQIGNIYMIVHNGAACVLAYIDGGTSIILYVPAVVCLGQERSPAKHWL